MRRTESTERQIENLAEAVASVIEAAGSTVHLDLQAVWLAAEVCAYYRIGRDTLREYMAKGLPYVRIKGTYRFERLKVKCFFEKEPK
ncbi:MAG: hypothetical protein ABIK83_02675 [Candidatus Zixiibacteriota bacterium]